MTNDSTSSCANHSLKMLVISIVCCLLTGVAYGFGMYLFPMVMPEMLADLSLSYTDAGIITGFGQLAPLAIIPLTSYLSHRFGALRLIVSSQIVGVILLLSLSFVNGFYSLLFILLLLRGWPVMVWIPLISVATDHLDSKWRATMLTTASSSACLFVFINGLVSSFFLEHYHWRSLWQVVALVGLIFGIGSWFALRWINAWKNQSGNYEKRKGTYSEMFRWCRTRSGMLIFSLFGITGLSFVPFQMYLAPYLRDDLGVGLDISAVMWSVMGISGMVGGVVIGIATDRFGAKMSMSLVYSLGAISSIMILLPITPVQIIIMAVLFGIAQAAIFGLGPSYISKVMSPEAAVTTFSSASMVMVLTSFVGNFWGGWSGGNFGSFWWLYVSLGVLFVLGVLLTFGLDSEKT